MLGRFITSYANIFKEDLEESDKMKAVIDFKFEKTKKFFYT